MKKKLWWLLAVPALAAALLIWRHLSLPSPDVLSKEELESLAGNRDTVRIEATLLPEQRTMHVKQELHLTSRTEQSRDQLVLRTWPNAFQYMSTSPINTEADFDAYYPRGYSLGALTLQEVTISVDNGPVSPCTYRYTDDAKTVLSITLPHNWDKDGTIAVSLEYSVILPVARSRFGVYDGVYCLSNVFPLPALWENGQWRTDEYYPIGDPGPSEVYAFDVTLTAPEAFQCAAPALPHSQQKNQESITWQYQLPAARDFCFAFSEEYRLTSVTRGGVTVQAFTKNAAAGRRTVRYALQALEIYSRLYGVYPYQCYTLAEFSFPYSGVEAPGIALISSDSLQAGGETLERVIAHETAHQWWYSLVGSDPIHQPWQDEALCEYSVLSYWRLRHGEAAAEDIYRREILPSLQVTYTATAGSPLSYFSGMPEYYVLVYNRGAAMLCALDEMMGGGLNDFLRLYCERHTFGMASREDFLADLTEYSGQDFQPLVTDYLDTRISP